MSQPVCGTWLQQAQQAQNPGNNTTGSEPGRIQVSFPLANLLSTLPRSCSPQASLLSTEVGPELTGAGPFLTGPLVRKKTTESLGDSLGLVFSVPAQATSFPLQTPSLSDFQHYSCAVRFVVFFKHLTRVRTRVGHWSKEWVPRKRILR